jgi:hypothetical protein
MREVKLNAKGKGNNRSILRSIIVEIKVFFSFLNLNCKSTRDQKGEQMKLIVMIKMVFNYVCDDALEDSSSLRRIVIGRLKILTFLFLK